MHAAAAAVFAPAARTRRWTQKQLHRMPVAARASQQRGAHLHYVPRSKQGELKKLIILLNVNCTDFVFLWWGFRLVRTRLFSRNNKNFTKLSFLSGPSIISEAFFMWFYCFFLLSRKKIQMKCFFFAWEKLFNFFSLWRFFLLHKKNQCLTLLLIARGSAHMVADPCSAFFGSQLSKLTTNSGKWIMAALRRY